MPHNHCVAPCMGESPLRLHAYKEIRAATKKHITIGIHQHQYHAWTICMHVGRRCMKERLHASTKPFHSYTSPINKDTEHC